MMDRLPYLALILALLLSACGNDSPPEGVLSKEEMTSLLIEMYLAEARISSVPINRDSGLKLFFPHEQEILERRGLADSTLKASYQYYIQRPEDLEKIMDTVIDSLTLREHRLTNQP